jgi:hypothetical protein
MTSGNSLHAYQYSATLSLLDPKLTESCSASAKVDPSLLFKYPRLLAAATASLSALSPMIIALQGIHHHGQLSR